VRRRASDPFFISMRNLNFGWKAGASGSKPDGPFSMAKSRSPGK
jgi:hypothetical protein